MAIQLSTKPSSVETIYIVRFDDAPSNPLIQISFSDGAGMAMRYVEAIGFRRALDHAINEAETQTCHEASSFVSVGISLTGEREAKGQANRWRAPAPCDQMEALKAAADVDTHHEFDGGEA